MEPGTHRGPLGHRSRGPESRRARRRRRLDLVYHQALLDGTVVELTAKEFEVLSFLARHAGRNCTHQMILQAVWGTGYEGETNYVHAYVHRLRQKLNDPSGTLIRSAPGVGYGLSADP